MNIQTIGTASSYIKNMALNIKWQERKLDPKKPKENEIKKEDPVIADIKRQIDGNLRSQKIESLRGKLLSGQKLNAEEMDYLRENSPDDYENAVKAEKEREEYKRELEACRSKEDVAKFNMRRLNKFGAEATAIANNPNIPADKKKTLTEGICMKAMGVMDEHKEFIKTPEYMRLPERLEDGDERETDAIPEENSGEEVLLEAAESKDMFGEIEKLLNTLSGAESAAPTGNTGAQETKIEAAAKPAVT